MNRRYALSLLVATPHLLLGCTATSPTVAADGYISPQFVPPPTGSLLLLLHLPANEPSYRSGDAEVRNLIHDELVKAGYKVAFVAADDYQLAVRHELEQLHGKTATPSSSQLAEAEMRALATVSKVGNSLSGNHLLIRTRLLTRSAKLWQSHAKWDGVSRPIVFEGAKPGEVRANIEGTGPAVSLEVVATGPEGRLQLKSYGGIALPFYAGRYGTPTLVESPLSVPENIREGVGIALSALRAR